MFYFFKWDKFNQQTEKQKHHVYIKVCPSASIFCLFTETDTGHS